MSNIVATTSVMKVSNDQRMAVTSHCLRALNSWLLIKGLHLFVARFVISLLNHSYMVPDEVWQSQEVAHHFVFGNGYLCWEWKRGIRSFLYPLLLSVPYYVLKILRLDTGFTIRMANHFFGAAIGSLVDLASFYIGVRLYGQAVGDLYLFLSLFNAFNFTHQSRTLINVLEGLLCQLFWICYAGNTKYKRFVLPIAMVGCALRATFPINCFIPILLIFFQGLSLAPRRTIKSFLYTAVIFFVFSELIDYMFYRSFTPSWWKFIKFNVLENLSSFYGISDSFWYFWNGLPVLSGLALAPFCYGALGNVKSDKFFRKIIFMFILPSVFLYSLFQHKEVRFLYQLQPFILLFAAKTLAEGFPWKKQFLLLYLLINVPIALHFSLVHQVGPLQMLDCVKEIVKGQQSPFVLFLSACHVSHYHCYMHNASLRMEMVSCEPPTCAQENNIAFRNDMMLLVLNPCIFTANMFATFTDKYPDVVVSQRGILEKDKGIFRQFLQQLGYDQVSMFKKSRWSFVDESKADIFVFVRRRP